jgi:hypothetical protein
VEQEGENMTTREKLKLMEEIKRKNDAAWEAEARRRRPVKCECKQMHPGAALMLEALITSCVLVIWWIVALNA